MDINKYISEPRTAYFAKGYQKYGEELKSLDLLVQDGIDDLVNEEKENLKAKLKDLENTIDEIVKEESFESEGANEVILEVRAGAGGDEASMFARDLALMYERFADSNNFNFTTISVSENGVGGYKEASFQIRGKSIYDLLRFETGVHRVQRVPATEKSGRVHTSTASVAVLPIKKKTEIHLEPSDLKMEFSRSGGAGGQNVNKVESAVRLLHIPTGLEVRCTEDRTQLKNREKAMSILSAKVENHIREKEESQYADMRRSQIGTGDRSEKIRTYNILQDRITDHRIKKNWSNIEKVFAGDVGQIFKDLKDAQNELEKEEE